jgi:hypothetical protein
VIRSGLYARVLAATNLAPEVVVAKDRLAGVEGFSTAFMNHVGLTTSDLKKLERNGLAMRGYTKNVWRAGELLPNGKRVEDDPFVSYRGKGHSVVWVLLKDGGEDGTGQDGDVQAVQDGKTEDSPAQDPGQS